MWPLKKTYPRKPWQRGWQDTKGSRLYSACSPPDRMVATILGAYRYPGPTAHQAHGTSVCMTSSPAQRERFYRPYSMLASPIPFSSILVPERGHDNCPVTSLPSNFTVPILCGLI
jgi:hypothetical protein